MSPFDDHPHADAPDPLGAPNPLVVPNATHAPNADELSAYWMPYTANRQFKTAPRLLARAKDMHYWTDDGRQILDGTAGLWCCNAGHNRDAVTEAIRTQAGIMDFAPPFQMGHSLAFKLAHELVRDLPGGLKHVFFTNSGSESVDTALKIALAYHRVRGEGARTRLIGRERGYHGVGFGGISVGGMVANRKLFGPLLAGVDHLTHTHNLAENAFSPGEPTWGAHLADDLERIVALHDASTIAAVIVEPIAGSTGVLIPPKGYLKRLREITQKHGILLIFDEVITGFGRLGTPFAAQYFGVEPDLICTAKGLTSGTVPMGAVFAQRAIYDTFMTGPAHAIELFHGYTYSAHPLACAAALAVQHIYRSEGLYQRVAELAPHWQARVQAMRGMPHVIDARNLGLIAGIELQPRPDQPTAKAFEVFLKCYERGLLVRTTGDTVALSPPFIISVAQIDEIFDTLTSVLQATA